ncbi:MAG: heme lyase CcmF/NrfE family subunit [Hyphomicrobiales bacterium]
MIAFIGNLLLWAAIISCILSILYSRIYSKNPIRSIRYTSLFGVSQFLIIFFSYILLTYAFIISDFSILTVWKNSEFDMPLVYKITGVWGNHEGSMLLWVLILCLFSFFVIVFDTKLPRNILRNIIFVQSTITLAFLLFIVFTSNPFIFQNPVPQDGFGLNTLLQDPGLIIHPPLLYIGYVGYSIVFSFAIAIMLEREHIDGWGKWIEKWVYISWGSLTAGICIGSWWAYYELGWGGWWFWDPVENASLLPWITGTALIHSLMHFNSNGRHQSWTLLLAILSFSFSLLGTFLVRSGVLTSVHSFASDPSRGLWILIIMSIFIVCSLLLFFSYSDRKVNKSDFVILSRGSFIQINNYLMVTSCIVVLLGTIYPLILDALTGDIITVGPQYFNLVMTPILIFTAILMPIGPNLPWSGRINQFILKKLFISLALTISILLLLQIIIEGKSLNLAIFFIGLVMWIIIVSLIDILPRNIENISFSLSKIDLQDLRKINPLILSSRVIHAGFGLMLIGIVAASAYAENKDTKIKLGEEIQLNKFSIKYTGVSAEIGENYDDLVMNFEIYKEGKEIEKMLPRKRIFRKSGDITTEAAINRYFFDHIFLTIGEVDEGHVFASISYKPLVRLIWLGGFLMVFGAFIRLNRKTKLF